MSRTLDKLKDLKLYRNRQINTLNSELPNERRDQLILHVGTMPNDIIKLLRSRMFRSTNFNSYYADRIYRSYNRRVRLNLNRSDFYNEIKQQSGKSLRTRNNVSDYQGYNLYVDVTKLFNIELQSLTKRKFFTYKKSLEFAIDKSNISSYSEVVIYFNIDNIASRDKNNFIATDNLNMIGVLKRMFRRGISFNFDFDTNQNVSIMIGSPSQETFFKMPLDDKFIIDNKVKIISRIEAISNFTPVFDKEDDEEIKIDDPRFEKIENARGALSLNADAAKNRLKELFKREIDSSSSYSDLEDVPLVNTINKLVDDKIKEKYSDEIDEDIDEEDNIDVADEIYDDIIKDEEALDQIADSFEEEVIGKSNAKKKKQLERLNLKQEEVIKATREKFETNLKKSDKKKIVRNEIPNLNVVNKEVQTTMMVNDFDDSYLEKQYIDDIINTFSSFNDDVDIPVYIDKINIEDTSDTQTAKDTLTVKLKDDKNTTHSVTIDIPKIFDGRYMMINGSKKTITKQLMMLPIVKTKPNEVWITTNINKIIMEVFGRKNDLNTNYLLKLTDKANMIKDYLVTGTKFNITKGNASSVNITYPVAIDYMDLSAGISNIKIITKDKVNYDIHFNQKVIRSILEDNKMEIDLEKYYPIGFINDKKLLLSNNHSGEIIKLVGGKEHVISKSMNQFLISIINEVTNENINQLASQSVKANESMSFSRCKIIGRKIPTIILLCSEIGLSSVLDKSNIDFTIEESNKSIKLTDNKAKIKFKDKYIIYDTSVSTNSLLLSGLSLIDTTNYTMEEMDTKAPYLEYYASTFNSRNVYKGVHNALSLMVDKISKEILEDLGQPTNIIDILLYANSMLKDLSSYSFNDMNIYRIRGAEQVNAVLYKLIAESYKNYKDSYTNRNPIKVSVPKDALVKELMKISSVEGSTDLNPSIELGNSLKTTYKGPSGRNSADTYTQEIRGYDESMMGILSSITPDSNTVGINRTLSYDAKIKGVRGYLDTSGNEENKLTDRNQLSAAELLNPFTSKHADSPRIGMQQTQQQHVVSTLTNDLPLISSGIEKSIPYQLSDGFVIKAKQNGTIETVDDSNNLVVLRYKDNTTEVFDISPKMASNATGGFFVEQKIKLLFKEGQSFKANDIIARNEEFFKGEKQGDISYVIGKFSKVAISANASTYEDSSLINKSMMDAMATQLTMKRSISIDKKSNIQFLVQEGQKIATGQPLAIFEPQFDDNSINDILDKIGSDFEEEIEEMSNKVIKSKYTGTIAKVNIYYNVELEEMSDSLRKLVESYIRKYKKKINAVKKYSTGENQNLTLEIPSIEKINSDKVKGNYIDGVLIEVYIQYYDNLNIGDKISFYSAIKTVISDIMEVSPYSDYRKEEEIEAVFSPLSVVSRMTLDVYMMLLGNKCLVELKRQIADLLK